VPFIRSGEEFRPAAWATASPRRASERYVFTLSGPDTEIFNDQGYLVGLGDRTGEQTISRLPRALDWTTRVEIDFWHSTGSTGSSLIPLQRPLPGRWSGFSRPPSLRRPIKPDLVG
jgi:hypothetical protein